MAPWVIGTTYCGHRKPCWSGLSSLGHSPIWWGLFLGVIYEDLQRLHVYRIRHWLTEVRVGEKAVTTNLNKLISNTVLVARIDEVILTRAMASNKSAILIVWTRNESYLKSGGIIRPSSLWPSAWRPGYSSRSSILPSYSFEAAAAISSFAFHSLKLLYSARKWGLQWENDPETIEKLDELGMPSVSLNSLNLHMLSNIDVGNAKGLVAISHLLDSSCPLDAPHVNEWHH